MRLTWGLFPYAIASLLVTVAVVDGAISWKAIHTFPGVVTHSQFTDSNRYDAVLEGAAREASLGWKSEFSLTGATPRVVLTDRDLKANSEFSINRKDFGLVYPGMPDDLIRDEVVIKLTISAPKGA